MKQEEGMVFVFKRIKLYKNIDIIEIIPSLKPSKGLEFRMGLTFFSDRIFQINESTDALYHCALALTDISSITDEMVSMAFKGVSKMYGGGDGPEDVLLGKFRAKTLRL